MRVLHVINGLGTGGAERSLVDLIEPLREREVDIHIAYLYEREEGVASEASSKTRTHQIGPGLPNSVRRLRALMRQIRPDLIHTSVFESDIVGRLASIGGGVPVLTSLINTTYSRSGASNPDVNDAKLAVAREIDGYTARHINAGFHALTEIAKAENARDLRLDPSLIQVVPRARSSERLGRLTPARRSRVRKSLGLDDSQPVILSVGRQEHQKGQIHAVESMGRLLAGYPDAILLIVGRRGSASARLRAMSERLGLEDRVRFLGHRGDVPDLMAMSDVLVFPSLYEGFGGTLVEAMALELPIVASDIPVLREVVDDAAVYAERGSGESLANGVQQILEHEMLARRLKLTGLHRFRTRYRIEAVADQMRLMYERFAR